MPRSKKKKSNDIPTRLLLLVAVFVALAGLTLIFVSRAYSSVDTTKAGTTINFTKDSNLNQQVSANNGTTRYNLPVKSGLQYCWWGTNDSGAQTQGSVRYNAEQTVAYGANDYKLSGPVAHPLFCFTAQYDSNSAEVFISVSGNVKFTAMKVSQP